jgi:hypothetical protein
MEAKYKSPKVDIVTISERDRQRALEYVLAGGEVGETEIAGYVTRASRHWDAKAVFVPGPFERGRRYFVQTSSDCLTFEIHGWIRGSELLRHGEPAEVDGWIGCFIDRSRLKPVRRIYVNGRWQAFRPAAKFRPQ